MTESCKYDLKHFNQKVFYFRTEYSFILKKYNMYPKAQISFSPFWICFKFLDNSKSLFSQRTYNFSGSCQEVTKEVLA